MPNTLVPFAIVLGFVGWFLIGVAFSRAVFNRGGAFAIAVGLIVSFAIPSATSVLFYHDPGGGDIAGPAWKRVGLGVSLFVPVVYVVGAGIMYILRCLRKAP